MQEFLLKSIHKCPLNNPQYRSFEYASNLQISCQTPCFIIAFNSVNSSPLKPEHLIFKIYTFSCYNNCQHLCPFLGSLMIKVVQFRRIKTCPLFLDQFDNLICKAFTVTQTYVTPFHIFPFGTLLSSTWATLSSLGAKCSTLLSQSFFQSSLPIFFNSMLLQLIVSKKHLLNNDPY